MGNNIYSINATTVSMQLVSSAFLALLSTPAMADWTKIQEAIDEMFNQTRTLTNAANPITHHLSEYGCWCNFENPSRGRGIPVDGTDALCKALHDGYECAAMDRRREDCVPHQVDYVPAGFTALNEQVINQCNKFNRRKSCAAYACILESIFVHDFF